MVPLNSMMVKIIFFLSQQGPQKLVKSVGQIDPRPPHALEGPAHPIADIGLKY